MSLPSQFIHPDHFYNCGDRVYPVEMIISLSLPFGDTLYHLYGFDVLCSDLTVKYLCHGPTLTASEEDRS